MQWRQTRFDPGMERGDGRVRPHGRARSPPSHHIPFGCTSQCVTRIGWVGDDLHEWWGQPCSTNQAWHERGMDGAGSRACAFVRPHGRARSPPLHHIPFGCISQCVTRIGWIGDDLHEWGGQPCSTNERGTRVRHGAGSRACAPPLTR